MLIIRPIITSDFDGLKQIAIDSGKGFTSLPVDDVRLQDKISSSVNSVEKLFVERGEQGYLFVLEDTETGKIVGTTAIEASVGLSSPFYHYRIGKSIQGSSLLKVRKEHELLTMCNDYTGVSEICTLYLAPEYRKTKAGRLLSKVRFMFMADHPERFSETIIAEMRGSTDEHGEPPFWHWLQEHFLTIDFETADHLVGTGQKSFISELMPKYPIYVNTLSEQAQNAIGKVHENTKPALGMLKKEGFEHKGYVDLFDAGPTVEAKLTDIKSVRESDLFVVKIANELTHAEEGICSPDTYALSNSSVNKFKATFSDKVYFSDDNKHIVISPELADALQVQQGEHLRALQI